MVENTNINFELLNYINSNNINSFKDLKVFLQENKIKIKYSEDTDLVILSNNYKENLNNLQKECRSLIIDKVTLDVICYTYDNILYNKDAKNEFLKINPSEFVIQESFEGTLLSIYNYKNKWYISTRQCIDASKSIWKNNISHFNLFLDCIDISFEEFTNNLNEDYNYFFVLVHYKNKHIVDYSKYFKDPEYKKIIHIMTRNKKTHQDIDLDDTSQWKQNPNFKTPNKFEEKDNNSLKLMKFLNSSLEMNYPCNHDDFGVLDIENVNDNFKVPIEIEGLIIKIKENNKIKLLKFQTNAYQFMSLLNPNISNIYMGFVELYQRDKLKQYLEYFPDNMKLNNVYDTIGVIDASFKVLTSELFELFRYLYDLKDCSHKNKEFYKLLPNEYTIVLYKIRGIYYKKKEKYIKNKIDMITMDNTYNYSLKIFDIYNLLKKNYEIKDILNLFHARKNFFSKYTDSKYNKIIKDISMKCDLVSLKMIDIFLKKIYPDD